MRVPPPAPDPNVRMAADEETAGVFYCYLCGKHVGNLQKNCYYCGSSTQRIIRSLRRCPFCDLPVRHKALKCQHCGEFLDGRPRGQGPPGQPNVTYVIDKAIIGSPQGLPLPGVGQAGRVGQVGQILGAPALLGGGMAIEEGRRGLIGYEGPKPAAMSQDEDKRTIDVKAIPAGGGEADKFAVVRQDKGALAPAPAPRNEGKELSVAAPAAPNRRWLARFTGSLMRRGGRPSVTGQGEDVVDAEIEPDLEKLRYRNCPGCATEVLADDNYCFHCGLALSPVAKKQDEARAPKEGTNVFLFLGALGAVGGVAAWFMGRPPLWTQSCAAAAILCGLIGVFRGRGFVSRLLSLLIAAAGGVYLFFDHPQLPF